MTSLNFLKERLQEIVNNFNDVTISYEYLEYSNTHIVELYPVEIFENDKRYMELEVSLENDFNNLYPNEEIVFVSENSVTRVENVQESFTSENRLFIIHCMTEEEDCGDDCDCYRPYDFLNVPTQNKENNYALAA